MKRPLVLLLGKQRCRTRFTRRASARTPGLGLWVLVMMAQLRSAMAVQS